MGRGGLVSGRAAGLRQEGRRECIHTGLFVGGYGCTNSNGILL